MANIKRSVPQRVKPTKTAEVSEADDTSVEETETEEEDQEVEDEADQGDGTTGNGDTDPAALTGEQASAASASAKAAAEQAGFAKRAGRTSTAPEKPKSSQRPYLESPRPFGIHIKGHLIRFAKGRTLINDQTSNAKEITGKVLADVLREHGYVADNGAELIE